MNRVFREEKKYLISLPEALQQLDYAMELTPGLANRRDYQVLRKTIRTPAERVLSGSWVFVPHRNISPSCNKRLSLSACWLAVAFI